MLSISRLNYITIILIVFGQMTLGALFYKSFLTEAFILASALFLVVSVFAFPYIRVNYYLSGFIFLGIIYVIYSVFVAEADSYWIARHGVILLYALAAVPFLQNKIPKAKLYYVYAALLCALVFSYLGWLIPGHANFVAFQVCIVLLCVLYGRVKMPIFYVTYIFVAVILFSTNEQTLLRLVVFMPIVIIKFVKTNVTNRMAFALLVLPLLTIAIILDGGAADYNAVWRYLYWINVLKYNLTENYVILGNGFGGPFILKEYDNYELLISQVSWSQNRTFQELSVPPHNAVLTLLHFMGLPGVLLVCIPVLKCFLRSVRERVVHGRDIALFCMCIIALNNQFIIVPYCAVLFWALWGGSTIWHTK